METDIITLGYGIIFAILIFLFIGAIFALVLINKISSKNNDFMNYIIFIFTFIFGCSAVMVGIDLYDINKKNKYS